MVRQPVYSGIPQGGEAGARLRPICVQRWLQTAYISREPDPARTSRTVAHRKLELSHAGRRMEALV
jgi:hypothetical protein